MKTTQPHESQTTSECYLPIYCEQIHHGRSRPGVTVKLFKALACVDGKATRISVTCGPVITLSASRSWQACSRWLFSPVAKAVDAQHQDR